MKALVIDDESLVRDNISEFLRLEGWQVTEADSAERALELLEADEWSLVFCDVWLGDKAAHDGFDLLRRFNERQPRAQIVLMTGRGSAAGGFDAMAFGAYDYLIKPFGFDAVKNISQKVRGSFETLTRQATAEPESPAAYTSDIDLIGDSPAFVEVMKMVGRVATTDLAVLITGESGTGKEVVARAVHRRSPRARGPFVALNCGAVPAELIESELFGHVRGAFTGADRDRQGLWQEAHGGTVFLDEITETSPAFQVKLLRAIQEGEIRRVGSNQTLKLDVRVIAATNRDPELEARAGRLRQDLLYRLDTVTIHLPPLRERRQDIMPLAQWFATRSARTGESPVTFSPEIVWMLEEYAWPGNVRELENTVMRAAALCDRTVRPEDLPRRMLDYFQAKGASALPPPTAEREADVLTLSEVEARHVAHVLERTAGNKQMAARLLGIDRGTLKRMIRRHNLDGGDKPDQPAQPEE